MREALRTHGRATFFLRRGSSPIAEPGNGHLLHVRQAPAFSLLNAASRSKPRCDRLSVVNPDRLPSENKVPNKNDRGASRGLATIVPASKSMPRPGYPPAVTTTWHSRVDLGFRVATCSFAVRTETHPPLYFQHLPSAARGYTFGIAHPSARYKLFDDPKVTTPKVSAHGLPHLSRRMSVK